MKEVWYSYGGFKFTKTQIKWAIAHLPLLRDGVWPPSHKESGYDKSPIGKKQPNTQAPFIKAASIAAELDWRIQRAGMKGDRIHDGLLLEQLYTNDPEDEIFIIDHIAMSHGISTKEISRRIRNALYFVSGENRKTTKYSDYVRGGHKYLKRE